MTAAEFVRSVKTRAAVIFLTRASQDAAFSFSDAERIALRALRIERSGHGSNNVVAAQGGEDIRDKLVRGFMNLVSRYREEQAGNDAAHSDQRAAPAQTTARVKVAKREQPPSDPTPPPMPVVGVYAGRSQTGAVRLGNEEFHTSYHDRTTANWRASISNNIERERRGRERWQAVLAKRQS